MSDDRAQPERDLTGPRHWAQSGHSGPATVGRGVMGGKLPFEIHGPGGDPRSTSKRAGLVAESAREHAVDGPVVVKGWLRPARPRGNRKRSGACVTRAAGAGGRTSWLTRDTTLPAVANFPRRRALPRHDVSDRWSRSQYFNALALQVFWRFISDADFCQSGHHGGMLVLVYRRFWRRRTG